MKKILFFFVLTLSFLQSVAQISSLNIEKKPEQERIVLAYDSLSNITRDNLPSLVGQRVQILPKNIYSNSDLSTGPTLYSDKPREYGNNDIVVNPDTRFSVYNSRRDAFTNEIFNIVGVDSISLGSSGTIHFYLIVSNDTYTSPHYLDIGSAHDDYNYFTKKLRKRGDYWCPDDFIILGYYQKLYETQIGKRFVNMYTNNIAINGEKPLFDLATGDPLDSVPENLILTIKDITIIDSDNFKGLAYIFSSDSIPDCFSRLYLKNFLPYNEFVENQQRKQEWKSYLIKQYGKVNGTLIYDKKVKIGFTKQMCEDAWGSPIDINKSTGSWGVHEQWVYSSGCYLYFENGKLTSIDN